MNEALEKRPFGTINEELRRLEGMLECIAQDADEKLSKIILHSLSGGKRIRPALIILASKMLGGDEKKSIKLAAAVEMLHNATLLHDDLIDEGKTRRSKATAQSLFHPSASILAGDYLLAKSIHMISDLQKIEVFKKYSKILEEICEGEIKQFFQEDVKYSLKAYYKRIELKTASLFRGVMEMTAIISDTSEKEQRTLSGLGEELGLAYQIIDDILDFTGDEKIGKPLGMDLRRRIPTMPIILYLEELEDKHTIEDILEETNCRDGLDKIIASIVNSPAIEKSIKKAEKHARNAKKFLNEFPKNEYTRNLENIIDYILERKR